MRSNTTHCLIVAAAFYCILGVITAVYLHYAKDPFPLNYYAKLGYAFSEGQTSFLELPDPKLLAVKEPYNGSGRGDAPFLWDASLYNGKYYMYFGPVPALVPWMIFYKVIGVALNDCALSLFFAIVGSCALAWSVFKTIYTKGTGLSMAQVALMSAVICFCTWVPWTLARASFYEAAILAGYGFAACGVACMIQAAGSSRQYRWHMLGSLCFGMAAGSRLVHGVSIAVPFVVWLYGLKSRNLKHNFINGITLAGPWAACIMGLSVYNYIRFGSFLETGFRYQLNANLDFVNVKTYSPDNGFAYNTAWNPIILKRSIYKYLFLPVPFSSLWPWGETFRKIATEEAYGYFTNSPFSLWAFWFLFKARKTKAWLKDVYPVAMGMVLYTIMAMLVILPYCTDKTRYALDFTPWMMLLAIWGYTHALIESRGKASAGYIIVLGTAMQLWGLYVGLVGSYCGFWGCAH